MCEHSVSTARRTHGNKHVLHTRARAPTNGDKCALKSATQPRMYYVGFARGCMLHNRPTRFHPSQFTSTSSCAPGRHCIMAYGQLTTSRSTVQHPKQGGVTRKIWEASATPVGAKRSGPRGRKGCARAPSSLRKPRSPRPPQPPQKSAPQAHSSTPLSARRQALSPLLGPPPR